MQCFKIIENLEGNLNNGAGKKTKKVGDCLTLLVIVKQKKSEQFKNIVNPILCLSSKGCLIAHYGNICCNMKLSNLS